MARPMIIKFLLITLLVLLAVFVIWQKITSPAVRSTALIILAIGAYFVWQPEDANAVAHVVGVGRGADLLMYLWVVITFSAVLVLYLKIVEMSRMLTELARRLALSQPLYPPDRSKP
jgi:hypothetical protein